MLKRIFGYRSDKSLFAEKLGLTVMTASRALNDLYDANLLIYEIGGKTGRSKEYRRISDPEYFEKGRRFIKSPVKKVVYVKSAPAGTLVAGLEALAELSMINPPNCSGSCWAWLAPLPTTTIRGQSLTRVYSITNIYRAIRIILPSLYICYQSTMSNIKGKVPPTHI